MSKSFGRMACAVATALLVGGCAVVPLEQGRSQIQSLVDSRAAVAAAVDSQVAQWLASPLTIDSAQRIALLRNAGLKAQYARLGLSAADVFEAGRLQNPSLGLSWLLPVGGAQGSKVGVSLVGSFADLLLRGSRMRIAAAEYAGMQQQIAAATLEVLAATQRAWFDCVAANQRVAVRRSIADAAGLAADMARQYHEAGNINALELQMQGAEASQSLVALHDAQMEQADARAELQKLLGLSAAQSRWSVPESLPEVPPGPVPATESLIALALEQRLDLSAARRHVQALAENVDATHRWRLLAESRVGAALDREGDGAKRIGPELEVSLPVFRQGQGGLARAQAQLAAAQASLREMETVAQADLARHVARLELAREQVKVYREGLIPQREAVVARIAEQANFMLVDRFAVLVARQQEYSAYAGYVDAQRRFWNAHVDLMRELGTQRGLEEYR